MPTWAKVVLEVWGRILLLALVYSCSPNDKLYSAVKICHYEEAARLISMGADVNAVGFLDFREKSGTTVLMVATGRCDARLVNLLLEKGANVNAKNQSGDTPLSFALWNLPGTRGTIVETLIAHGANVNETDNLGDTYLIRAIALQYIDVVKILLDHGVDVNRKDSVGRTALQFAQGYFAADIRRHAEIKRLLVQYAREHPPVQACDYKKAEEQIDGYQSIGWIMYIKGTDVFVAEKWLVSDFEHKKLINKYVVCFLTKGAMDPITVYYRNNYTGHVMATGTPSGFEM